MYGLGVFLVFMYYAITYIIRSLNLHKRETEFENFKKVGIYYNFLKDGFYFNPFKNNRHNENKNHIDRCNSIYLNEKEQRKKRILNNIYLIILQFIIFPLLSWISVIIILGIHINDIIEDKKIPKEIREKIKEANFKIKHNKLSKRQMRIAEFQIPNLVGKEITDDFPGDYNGFTLNCADKTVSIHNREEEYKIKGTDIEKRVINDRGLDEKYELIYYIKDGVVTDVKNPYFPKEKRKEVLKRRPSRDMRQNAYILYFDDNLSDNEFKDYLRQNIDNMESCRKEMREFFKKHHITFNKGEYEEYYISSGREWYNSELNDEERENNKKNFYKEMEKIAEKYGCKEYQFTVYNKIGEVEITCRRKVGDGEWHDDPNTIACIESTRDAFEPVILPFYKGLIKDI